MFHETHQRYGDAWRLSLVFLPSQVLYLAIASMNQQDSNIASTRLHKQWILGERQIHVSCGLADLITSDVLESMAGRNAVAVQMPSEIGPFELKTIARSAHEVWILHGEAAFNPAIAPLLEYRLHSIPVSDGERRSVLHAPELGIVRIFDTTPAGDLFQKEILLPLGETEAALVAAWEKMFRFTSRVGSIEDQAVLRTALATKQPITSMPNGAIVHLVNTLTLSAKLDERTVRWLLVGLFATTVFGVVLLQALAMAGWSVPMADIYAIFFMLVGSAYFWAREHHLNNRRLVYRLIAQALEVHLLWQRSSLDEPVSAHFQLRHHGSLKWVRELLRFTSMSELRPKERESSKSVLERWLPTAILENEKLANWHTLRATRIAWAVRFCYGLSGLLTLLLIAGPHLSGWWELVFGATLGITSSIGTLFLIFGGTLGYSVNAKLHRHLEQLLQRTHQALSLNLPNHEYDELLIDAGRECIHSAVERAFH